MPTADLFGGEELPGGLRHLPLYFDAAAQGALRDVIRDVVSEAPLFTPKMPRTGKPFSVRMSNCGPLGWVSDIKGYRYQPMHPDTGKPWPAMPDILLKAWNDILGADTPPPEACLINHYPEGAKMGMHQDRDETDLSVPVLSVSLGASARFRIGGLKRGGPTRSIILQSGDVFVLGGENRLAYHGIDRIIPGSSDLLKDGGRINLTMRRVSSPS